MQTSKHLIVIGGPTASGKTALSIALSQHFDSPVLSADSRQFYREMTIGTAKPSDAELAQAPHYFVNNLSIKENYTVADFERDALQQLDAIFLERNVAILVGGSGLFIKAVCEGLNKFPEVSDTIKETVELLYQDQGIEGLQKELLAADPDYYEIVDKQNPRRLMRALSVCRISGKPFSFFLNAEPTYRPFTFHYICLDVNREVLYNRINKRVDAMMASGLLDEVKQLHPYKELSALQTVGYAELFDYLGGLYSLDEAVELIKRNSRRYAKRQMTWFRRDNYWTWFSPNDVETIISYLTERLK